MYAQEVDGHNHEEIINSINNAKNQKDKPSMIVLNTIKGKDCSFAEDVFYNHHMTFTDEQYKEAIAKLDEIIKESENV